MFGYLTTREKVKSSTPTYCRDMGWLPSLEFSQFTKGVLQLVSVKGWAKYKGEGCFCQPAYSYNYPFSRLKYPQWNPYNFLRVWSKIHPPPPPHRDPFCLFSAICKGYNSTYNWYRGRPCIIFWIHWCFFWGDGVLLVICFMKSSSSESHRKSPFFNIWRAFFQHQTWNI